jgi:Dolichyl-phosphate-mannose-protein mannosyltransferase
MSAVELADSRGTQLASRKRERIEQALVLLIFLAANAALFVTAPKSGDFWWSDAPRHALNGAFIKDLIAAAPWDDLRQWAIDYYLKYPALTVLFYPPLFYFFLAPAYAVFGVSHAVAQIVVSLFTALLGTGTYAIVRTRFPRWSALGASLLVIGGPEVAFWTRQVMLDIPAYAVLVTGIFFYIRYIREEHSRDLYCAVAMVLAATYIKFSVVFIVPVLVVGLLAIKGPFVLRRLSVIVAAVIGILGALPAGLLTLKFGMINVQSVAGRSIDLPRASLGAWLFYIQQIPDYLGWLGAALAACGAVFVLLRRAAPLEMWFGYLLLLWFAFGYLFFSLIGLREPRHGMMIAFPLAILAILALHRVLPRPAASAAATALGIATFLYSLLFYPAPAVEGYAAVADYVAKQAPENSVVMFSGYRDGNFIFNMRTQERHDISILRADKLLLRIAVERERGVREATLDQEQIAQELHDLGISLVAAQPDFWSDLRVMRDLSAVLQGPNFKEIARFAITGQRNPGEETIVIYQPTYPVIQTPRTLSLEMPIINQIFRGTEK